MGYTDLFSETWKAFTDYPIIRLHEYDKKRVTMFHYPQYTNFKEHSEKIEYYYLLVLYSEFEII